MDRYSCSEGFCGRFSAFNVEPHQYTWWDMMTRARERNVGWRIDYFFATDDLIPKIKNAWIAPEVMGSDHCPVGLEIEAYPRADEKFHERLKCLAPLQTQEVKLHLGAPSSRCPSRGLWLPSPQGRGTRGEGEIVTKLPASLFVLILICIYGFGFTVLAVAQIPSSVPPLKEA